AQEALQFIEKKEYENAANALPGKFHSEKIILKSLSKKIPAKVAFNRIRRENKMMYLHSYQSKLFNDVLEQRLIKGLKSEEYCTEESVSSITGNGDITEKVKTTTEPKIENILIPLYPTPEVNENAPSQKAGMKGGFRKAVIIPDNMEYSVANNVLSLSFDLPPGTYATMLVKEIAQNEVNEVSW
ncbi:hypothetical protein NEMIN01_2159, partial [Nematocida minor]|uniref:uncharacterized protein n=1 Tax=Nematocida minor TaxID=1912983 RepID=UPI002220416E